MKSLRPKICPAINRTSSTLSDSKIGSKAFPEKILQEEALMAMRSSSSGFIKIDKLSEVLGVQMPTLRRWEKNASMPASIRFGGRIRYWKVAILKRWIATLESLPAEMQEEVWQGIAAAAEDITTTTNNQDKS